jgi:hypothetical protein
MEVTKLVLPLFATLKSLARKIFFHKRAAAPLSSEYMFKTDEQDEFYHKISTLQHKIKGSLCCFRLRPCSCGHGTGRRMTSLDISKPVEEKRG